MAIMAAIIALIIGAFSGCAKKQTTKIWTDEDIKGFFKTKPLVTKEIPLRAG